MTFIDYAQRVFRYGPRGVVAWLCIKWGKIKAWFLFQCNARCFTGISEPGVTLIGPFTGYNSLSKVMRDLLFMIRDAGIPFQALTTGGDGDSAQMGLEGLLTPVNKFQVKKYSLVLEMFEGLVPRNLISGVANIAFWEFEDGFLPVYPTFSSKKHVIGMSDFVVDVLRKELPSSVKVSKLLYPFRLDYGKILPRNEARNRFKIPIGSFAVFFNFDFGSGFHRKNPEAAMRTFSIAINSIPDAVLVFKTMRSGEFHKRVEYLERLASQLGIEDKFVMINDYLSDADVISLTKACDVYLSLHRGEGFGLGVAEAMSLGLPVVVSDYSATKEFCNEENSIPVPCKIVSPLPNQRDHLTYSYVSRWAEPDVTFAAQSLIRLRRDPVFRECIGRQAKVDIAEHFSVINFKSSIEKLLHLGC